nr:hypothetical protein Ccrd_012103 [Ipomoea trifida]
MSPEAVMEPRRGRHGVMLWLSNLVMASKISNLMPDLPDELVLKSMTVLGSPVRGAAEAGGDAVGIGAIDHAVHNPVTAGFDAGAGSLGELHFHGIIAGGDSGNLSDGEGLASELHRRVPELRHHALHFIQVAALQ